MTPHIAKVLQKLFPESIPNVDFVLQDDSDGRGPYIREWNIEAPQPSESEIDAVSEEIEKGIA